MYAVTSIPFFRRTRATLRNAEFGFFGVIVNTRVHVPDACGQLFRAGHFVFAFFVLRQLRTNWLIVGKPVSPQAFHQATPMHGVMIGGILLGWRPVLAGTAGPRNAGLARPAVRFPKTHKAPRRNAGAE
jgi:hypothetical protein